MSLVSLSSILKDARKKRYGVGMFDVHNLEMTNAVIEAAEEEKSPVILALAEVHAETVKALEDIANIMVYAGKRSSVPVCVHFDHGMGFENIIRVMHLGFSSVMFDGSTLPYQENIARTAEITRIAAIFGASVEGELGHVGGAEGGGSDGGMVYTEPAEAADFAEKTKVDALAVSIGTAHGVYTAPPKLDLPRLREIAARVSVPLVLHGGSGLSDLDFRNCIQAGVVKINIYTDLVRAAMERIQCEVAAPYSPFCQNKNRRDPADNRDLAGQIAAILMPLFSGKKTALKYPDLMRFSTEEVKALVQDKMKLFGSSGRA
ncbi:MAG: class II fructose-bisphosphate aldolase [Treponema sp.]|jgi:fructose-bisphosphate aldolase class II|nr:class II fructose-bisphosphate aldolase [Treponema sp.]